MDPASSSSDRTADFRLVAQKDTNHITLIALFLADCAKNTMIVSNQNPVISVETKCCVELSL